LGQISPGFFVIADRDARKFGCDFACVNIFVRFAELSGN
jgi:hypothetical protein